jgi:hypothetical protein
MEYGKIHLTLKHVCEPPNITLDTLNKMCYVTDIIETLAL